MNRTIKTGLLALSLAIASNAQALETPKGGVDDYRVKTVNYNNKQVVKIVGHYGFSTHIEFDPSENIENIAIGDKDAWSLLPTGNHLFLKPVADEATTNMTVITSRRVYNFELSAHWSQNGAHPHPNDMFFQVSFKYPEDALKKHQAEQDALKLKKRLEQDAAVNLPVNWNYWSCGSRDLMPIEAFDDGRFTHLTFSKNTDMPAIYMVDANGEESLVNTHIDPEKPNTIEVHKVVRQLVLRKGQSVTCLFNKSFNPRGGVNNDSGTTTPGVERVIRGQGN